MLLKQVNAATVLHDPVITNESTDPVIANECKALNRLYKRSHAVVALIHL